MKINHNKKISSSNVYALLTKIPKGRVTTYGDIAEALGNRKAARLIGKILHNNPNPITVPCHRVIRSDGTIGGYFFGQDMKKKILKKEGLVFKNLKLKTGSAIINARSLSEL